MKTFVLLALLCNPEGWEQAYVVDENLQKDACEEAADALLPIMAAGVELVCEEEPE